MADNIYSQFDQDPASAAPAPAAQPQNPYAAFDQAATDQPTLEEAEQRIGSHPVTDALGQVALAVTSPLGFGSGALEAGAGAVAKTLAGPVTGQAIGGGLIGFINALEDKIQGNESHVGASTAIGAAEGGAIGKTANILKGLVSSIKGLNPQELQEVQDLAAQHGVPLHNTDIIPPKTAFGKNVRSIIERIPYAGTGGVRAAQQEARETIAKKVSDKFNEIGYSADALIDSIMSKDKGIRKAANDKYKGVLDEMTGKAVDSSKTQAAINQHIQELTTSPETGAQLQSVDNHTVNTLQSVANDIQADPSFANLQRIRRHFRENIRGGNVVWPDRSRQIADNIYGAMGNDLKGGVQTHLGSAGLTKWNSANNELRMEAEKVHDSALKQVFKKGEITPETAERLLNSKDSSAQKQLYDALDDKGRSTALAGVIHGAIQKATDVDGNLNPTRLASELTRKEDTIAIFGGKDRAYLKGVAKVLNATRHAQNASLAPETGAKTATIALSGGAAITAMMGHPAGLAIIGLAGLLGRAYESPATRKLIMRLGNVKMPPARTAKTLAQIAERMKADNPDQSAALWSQ